MVKKRIEELFSRVKKFPETEDEFLVTVSFLAIVVENFIAQKLGHTKWAGIPWGTEIDEGKVKKEIQECPMFIIITLHLTHMSENLKLGPHPEDGVKEFKEWFEKTAKKYNLQITYRPLFSLVKKDEKVIRKSS